MAASKLLFYSFVLIEKTISKLKTLPYFKFLILRTSIIFFLWKFYRQNEEKFINS